MAIKILQGTDYAVSHSNAVKVKNRGLLTDELASMEGVLLTTAVTEGDITAENYYVKTSNAAWTSSTNMRSWRIVNNGYRKISIHVRNNDANAFALSFFESETMSASTKLFGQAFSVSDYDDIEIDIPANVVLIVVTTHKNYLSNSNFTVYKIAPSGTLSNVVGEVGRMSNVVNSVEQDADDLKDSVSMVVADKNNTEINQAYVRVSDSTWITGNVYQRTWKITNNNYYKLIAHVRDNSNNVGYAIAIFSSDVLSSSTLILSRTFSVSDYDDFEIEIPANAVTICITTRNSYLGDSYFSVYSYKESIARKLEQIDGRVYDLETRRAIEPFDYRQYQSHKAYDNNCSLSGSSDYVNYVADYKKYFLSDYLIDGKLCIWCEYSGENQIKCKIPYFKQDGTKNGFNGWTVLHSGANYITPTANTVYFSICMGMNDSGGTEIDASDVSMYSGLYYLKNLVLRQIAENIDAIQDLKYRVNLIENHGIPLNIAPSSYYYGRPLQFQRMYAERYTTLSITGMQSCALWNGLLFLFVSELASCRVIDMTNISIIQTITLEGESNFHCNCANFGVEKFDASDEFPLLYVDACFLPKCYVYRITGERGSYSLTKVQTINYPTSGNDGNTWSHPQMFIDRDRAVIWIGCQEYTPKNTQNNIILRCVALPSLSEGDMTISVSDVTDTIILGPLPVMQGGSIYNGELFLGVGYGDESIAKNKSVHICELYGAKNIVTSIPISSEPQTPFVYENTLRVLTTGRLYTIYTT